MRYLVLVLAILAAWLVPAHAIAGASSHRASVASVFHLGPRVLYPTVRHARDARLSGGSASGSETLSYGGGNDGIGVISGTPKVYLIFAGSQWGTQATDSNGNLTFSNDPAGVAPYLQQMFKGLGTGGERWSGTMTQYCDGPLVQTGATSCPAGAPHVGYPTGGALAGVWYDNSAAEPETADSTWLGQEAVAGAAHFGNVTPASNRYAQYVVLSAHGLDPDTYLSSGFCAWHDGVFSNYGPLAFTNMPYVVDAGQNCGAGFVNPGNQLDGESIVEGHEDAETLTDTLPSGGWTNQSGGSYGGQEDGDECAWLNAGQGAAGDVQFATGSFAMQSTWSNDTNECDLSHPIVGGTPPTPTPSPSPTPTKTPIPPTPSPTPSPTPTPKPVSFHARHWEQYRTHHHLSPVPYLDANGHLMRVAWQWQHDHYDGAVIESLCGGAMDGEAWSNGVFEQKFQGCNLFGNAAGGLSVVLTYWWHS